MTPTNDRQRPTLINVLALFVVWLLLTNSFSVGNILLAAILAIGIPLLVGDLQTTTPTIKRPLLAARYVLKLLMDIIVSNFVVAKQVLGPLNKLQPGFIAIPLDMDEPLAITMLASSISLTPGTVSTELSADHKVLYVHALNVDNEAELIATIKQRYEQPLKEIFGC